MDYVYVTSEHLINDQLYALCGAYDSLEAAKQAFWDSDEVPTDCWDETEEGAYQFLVPGLMRVIERVPLMMVPS